MVKARSRDGRTPWFETTSGNHGKHPICEILGTLLLLWYDYEVNRMSIRHPYSVTAQCPLTTPGAH